MILRTVQIVVQDWKLCPQKHAKLLRTPWASLTEKNQWVATGNTPHLDALFIRAAHKTAIYILEPKGTTMESFEPYAMVHRLQYFSQVYVTRSLRIPLPKCEPRPELLCDLVLWAVAWLGSVSAPRSPKVDPPSSPKLMLSCRQVITLDLVSPKPRVLVFLWNMWTLKLVEICEDL